MPRNEGDITLERQQRADRHLPTRRDSGRSLLNASNYASNDKPAYSKTTLEPACPKTKYHHLVRIGIGGPAVALQCYICNADRRRDGVFFGVQGYHLHVINHHSEAGLNMQQVFEKAEDAGCLRRVSEGAICRVNAGEHLDDLNARMSKGSCGSIGHDPKKESSDSDIFKTEAPSTHPTQYEQLDPGHYSTVIYLDGEWYAVACHLCGASVCPNEHHVEYGEFWRGMRGLHIHVLEAHVEESDSRTYDSRISKLKGWAKTAALCTKQKLSQEDVARIKAGKQPKVKIDKCVALETTLDEAKVKPQESSRFLTDDRQVRAEDNGKHPNNIISSSADKETASFPSQIHSPTASLPPSPLSRFRSVSDSLSVVNEESKNRSSRFEPWSMRSKRLSRLCNDSVASRPQDDDLGQSNTEGEDISNNCKRRKRNPKVENEPEEDDEYVTVHLDSDEEVPLSRHANLDY